MDRFWLLTTTTYGTWLPGDPRGFVSPVCDDAGCSVLHNVPGTPYDADLPRLQRHARKSLKDHPVSLTAQQAAVLLQQFRETADVRGWSLLAVAIMANHVHVVVGVSGDPDPADVLRDLKSYGSRALNRHGRRPASSTWWTASGSKRKLPDEASVLAAIEYVRRQKNPLLIWIAENWLPRKSPPQTGG